MMFMLCGLMWYCRKAAKEMEDKKKSESLREKPEGVRSESRNVVNG